MKERKRKKKMVEEEAYNRNVRSRRRRLSSLGSLTNRKTIENRKTTKVKQTDRRRRRLTSITTSSLEKLKGNMLEDDDDGSLRTICGVTVLTSTNEHGETSSYLMIKEFERSTFAQIFMVRETKSGKIFAMKIVNAAYSFVGENEMNHLKRIQAGRRADDGLPIVKLYDFFYHDRHCCLVVEWLGRSLHTLIAHSSIDEVSKAESLARRCELVQDIGSQLLSALCVLKDRHVIHADIKPANILLKIAATRKTRKSCRLIDFGNSMTPAQAAAAYAHSPRDVQTLNYRAPEVLLRWGGPLTHKIDLWSLGCVLLELYIGERLFKGDSAVEVLAEMIALIGSPPPELRQSKLVEKAHALLRSFATDRSVARSSLLQIAQSSGEAVESSSKSPGACSLRGLSPARMENRRGVSTKTQRRRTHEVANGATHSRGSLCEVIECDENDRVGVRLRADSTVVTVPRSHIRRVRKPSRIRRDSLDALVPPQLGTFLRGLLCWNPDDRFSARDALFQPFLQSFFPFGAVFSACRM